MSHDEMTAQSELSALASTERGRRLLQLALRGVQQSGRGLTIGCWVKPDGGVSGCVFQHAYWQGVSEGAFQASAAADHELKAFVPDEDFRLVMGAIRALDALGRHRFLRRHGLSRVLDEAAWRDTVERLLVDALADTAEAPEQRPILASS
ncbi:MAG TPA: hypothetical protein VH306_07645 [Gaiellaceae bacterium]|jgi:hypothetical protein